MATEVETKLEETNDSFAETILGTSVKEERWAAAFLRLSPTWRVASVIGLLGALLFIPFLGSVGLWDPWETHYGEVGRSMIQRNDYVYPFWENAWFFSKPPMTMWLQAFGMLMVGANDPDAGAGAWLPALILVLLIAGGVALVFWRRGRPQTGLKFAAGIAAVAIVAALIARSAASRVDAGGGMGLFTEWGMRLPFVALSITALVLLSVALARVVNVRTGLAVGFVLATMPLYFLLTRQTVTDTPFVTTLIAAMACAIIGQLDPNTRHRAGWWYAFYVFAGVSTLAKGLLGVGLPAVILLVYAFLSVLPTTSEGWSSHLRWLTDGDFRRAAIAHDSDLAHGQERMTPALWAQMKHMKLGSGILVFFAVAAPWYLTLSLFEGVDDEGKNFFTRFFIHDHFNRLGGGVHTTTPFGSFTYFVEQAGYAIFPWVAAVPGAIAVASRLRLRSLDPAQHVGVIAVVWTAFSFLLLGSSATKFHHYVFPILPGLAILIALFIDRLWRDGIARHAVPVIFGLVAFLLVQKDLVGTNAAKLPGLKHFTDLFVYNYDRPYPADLAHRSIGFLMNRPIAMADLISLLLIAIAAYLLIDALTPTHKKERARWETVLLTGFLAITFTLAYTARVAQNPGLFFGISLLIAFAAKGITAFVRKVSSSPAGRSTWSARYMIRVLYVLPGMAAARVFMNPKVTSALQSVVTLTNALSFTFILLAVVAVIGAIRRSRTVVFGSVFAFALGFALWFNWSHWVDLSHNWTQRDQFWRYYRDRQPGEPITAFLMNWRGETFYSRNTVVQIKDNARMRAYADQPGREWALVEHNRLPILRTAVGADKKVTTISPELNNKFVLVTIE